jgi:hypothetical protein
VFSLASSPSKQSCPAQAPPSAGGARHVSLPAEPAVHAEAALLIWNGHGLLFRLAGQADGEKPGPSIIVLIARTAKSCFATEAVHNYMFLLACLYYLFDRLHNGEFGILLLIAEILELDQIRF